MLGYLQHVVGIVKLLLIDWHGIGEVASNSTPVVDEDIDTNSRHGLIEGSLRRMKLLKVGRTFDNLTVRIFISFDVRVTYVDKCGCKL